MAFDINTFRAMMALEGGFARPSLYEATIVAPRSISLFNGRSLKYKCETAEIPGRSITTLERRNYGIMDKFGYQTFYAETNLIFYESANFSTRNFFEAWMDAIYNTTTNNVKYYDDYVGTVIIKQFSEGSILNLFSDATAVTVKMIEAFPISVGPMPLSWGENDSVHKVNVTFVYRKYELE